MPRTVSQATTVWFGLDSILWLDLVWFASAGGGAPDPLLDDAQGCAIRVASFEFEGLDFRV